MRKSGNNGHICSFAGLDAAKSSIKSLDTWMDLEKDYGLAGFRKATDLRKTWPHLKVNIRQKNTKNTTEDFAPPEGEIQTMSKKGLG